MPCAALYPRIFASDGSSFGPPQGELYACCRGCLPGKNSRSVVPPPVATYDRLPFVRLASNLIDVWRIDDLHLVSFVEDGIGHSFPYDDTGNLRDHVVEALEVLDVQRL